ncbi:hypothetical protein MBLNU457_g2548t1 [Dothideomycetes sp. NU457]
METFRVRLNCIDHYQAVPTELDPPLWGDISGPSQKNAPQVPIIRVFGATETGQKVCAHIRGAFPYLYLEYNGSLAKQDVDAYIQTLRVSIDHALAVSYRRNSYDGRAVFVAHISLVKGVPFFGYQVGYKYFLKVYILNPMNMTRLADLLHQGAIMKRSFQPYESHLQYLLQWMCDFNLYGCAYIDTNKPFFRSPVPEYLDLNSAVHKWHDRSIPPSQMLSPDTFPRQSHCSIEVDICVQDILNRHEIVGRPLHQDFIERFNYLAPDEKLVHSMAGLWRDETKRRKMRMGITDPGSSPFPPEVLVTMSADPRNTDKGGWIHEEEYRQKVEELVKDERKKDNRGDLNFDNFVKPRPEEAEIQTTLESVDELFLDKFKQRNTKNVSFAADLPEATQAVVDVASVLRFAHEEDGDESDEERAKEQVMTQRMNAKKSTNSATTSKRVDIDEDESRPGGEAYADESEDPEDPVNSEAFEPKDAETRESRLDHMAVPRETVARIHGQPTKKRSLADEDQPPKRRRLSDVPDETNMEQGYRSRRNAPKVKDVVRGADLLAELDKQESAQFDFAAIPASGQIHTFSQGSQGHAPLPFPVVKNPHDPHTIQRLSQKSQTSVIDKLGTPQKPSTSTQKSAKTPKTPWSAEKSTANITPPSKHIHTPVTAKGLAEGYTQYTEAHKGHALIFASRPPSKEDVEDTMIEEGRPPVIYQDAYYSEEKDVPERSREYAGQEFKLESNTVPYLPAFDPTGESAASRGEKNAIVLDKAKEELKHQKRRWACNLRHWEIGARPPSFSEVVDWMKHGESSFDTLVQGEQGVPIKKSIKRQNRPAPELSQIDGPTQKNRHGFKFSQKQKSTSVQHETQYMSTLSLEVHINSRHDLAPDPEHDEISCIFWCLQSDDDGLVDNESGLRLGCLVLDKQEGLADKIRKQVNIEVEQEEDELDLINSMVDIVRSFDPDILTGYEVHNSSWGYLIERARLKYEYNLPDEFSRMKSQSHGRFGKDADKWGFNHTSTIRITGRHMINVWRAMRSELNLLQYTMENVVFHLLHRRIPHYTFADLSRWYRSSKPRDLAKVLDYFLTRVKLDLEILDANELIARTSEQARLLGVDFFSVFSRGSQFKVESIMFRIAKPENFVLVSPSRKQVGSQNALECLPLVMEPQSAFYSSPLLVLDFQSLYPSVMIAYNLCYSTCLGRITSWRGTNKMGFMDFKREPRLLELVKDKINIAPNGMMYVKPEMRKSLLAKMLGELLETRVMVKSGMKVDKDDRTLQQLLNNRQLALKLLANVTYGYTSASFSGRMPCSEIADSIVQTGRETLEKAIALIHSVSKWGAEVVYGDTDSLFVYLKGKTKDQAFDIGNEIAKAVTDMNPRPVKLKFEKVYHPCVLLAKKRYVGYKYEHRDQVEPEFDAKGIETVRRDGTPAEQRIEEKALKMLFRTADLSQVKSYFQAQCTKIMTGKFSVQDFCFAKEVKLGTYADKGPPPPGALIATKRMLRDPRTEPQYGERVPYVVIAGAPGARLFERCVEPERLLHDEFAELDAEYYINKNLIPPLERIFNLMGANVRAWFDEMPKVQRARQLGDPTKAALIEGKGRKTMESYMATSLCLVCRAKLPPASSLPPSVDPPLPLCDGCASQASHTLLALRAKVQQAQRKKSDLDTVCRNCSNLTFGEEVKCDSRDCPVFYSRMKANTKLDSTMGLLDVVIEALERRESAKVLDW